MLLCIGTYRLHAHDGLLHLGDICDVVLIGFELLLLDPFIDAYHQLSGDVSTIIHTYQFGRKAQSLRQEGQDFSLQGSTRKVALVVFCF